ncbi:MAG: aminoacyl-tRNA hydrolase [Chloroflexi bacterium]|nr:aminoacyl-tRNA hydrolase [Chloroflexota bacterium]MCH7655437.1 aminoacyl-tRNA hydrolase [Chloroflexota bacterium]
MIRVTDTLWLGESEVEFSFFTASGPGGQHVNKVATAAQLRFDAAHSPSIPDGVRARLRSLAGRRMTGDGVVIIKAQRFRSQDRNRADAIERLVSLIRRAAEPQRSRRATAPTKASIHRRLDAKARQGRAKQLRGPVGPEE